MQQEAGQRVQQEDETEEEQQGEKEEGEGGRRKEQTDKIREPLTEVREKLCPLSELAESCRNGSWSPPRGPFGTL